MSLPTSDAKELPPPLTVDRPTMVRYSVLALTVAMSVILYLDRFAFTASTDAILADQNLTKQQFGWISSVFFLTYALCQVPAALWADQFGRRWTITFCVAGWSLTMWGMAATPPASIIHPLYVFMFFRGLMGITQAAAYPVAAAYLRDWIPLEQRSLANGLVTMGGRGGGLLTNFATPRLIALCVLLFPILAGCGWRVVFLFYGAIGLIWSVAFAIIFRDRPEEHPGVNDAERALIEGGQGKQPATSASNAIPWQALLSPNLWLISGVNFFMNGGWIFLATYIQLFFREKPYVWSAESQGLAAALIGFGGMLGNVLGGVSNDAAVARFGIPLGRRINGLIVTLIAAGIYVLCLGITNGLLLAGMFVSISFLLDCELSSRWAVCQDIGGRNTGVIVGFANMCGNLGAFLFGILIGLLAEFSFWDAVFQIAAASLLASFLCWFFIDPTQAVVSEEAPAAAI